MNIDLKCVEIFNNFFIGITVDSLYLDYPLSPTCLYPELLSWSIEYFHQIHLNLLSIYRTSLYQTSLYLEQTFWSHCNYSLLISNFLLACSVIQVSYRVSYKNAVESF